MSSINPDEFHHDGESVSVARPLAADRIVYWPIINAVGWPLIFVLVWSGPLMLLVVGAPLVLLLWVLLAVAVLFDAAMRAQARQWRGFLSIMVFPLITLVAVLNLGFVWRSGQELGSYIHFYVMRPAYLREISKLPSEEPRLELFYWRGWLLKSTEVVYDESDEITLPPEKHSEGWRKRAAKTDAECSVLDHFSMGGHFYIITFDC